MKHFLLRTLTAVAMMIALPAASALGQAQTFTVDTTDDTINAIDGQTSLREAVISANTNTSDGDVILFDNSLSGQTILLVLGQISIQDDVIVGSDSSPVAVTIDGNAASRIFSIDTQGASGSGDVTVYDITFTNGSDFNGGAINISAGSSATFSRCGFDGNSASGSSPGEGGGALYTAGALTLIDTDITNNTAVVGSGNGGGVLVTSEGSLDATRGAMSNNTANRAGGAVENNDGTATFVDVTFDGNVAGPDSGTAAPGNGGAIHVSATGTTTITGGSASSNNAFAEGGAFWNGSGTMTIDGTTIGGDLDSDGNIASGNNADNGGGGVFNVNGTLNISNATIKYNKANGTSGSGGGVLADSGSVSIDNTTISYNTSNRAGGGIESTRGATLTIDAVQFSSNSTGSAPGNGGAIHVTGGGNTTITGGSASANIAASEGGAFWNGSGTMSIDGTTVGGDLESDGNIASGNDADNGGGGLFNNGGALVVSNASVSYNKAGGTSGSGGGIFNNGGTLTIESSSLESNVANRAGGGIEDNATATATIVTLTDVNFYNNVAGPDAGSAAPGNGGAIHVSGSGAHSISGGTVTGNRAFSEGGGFWNGSGTMTIEGTTLGGQNDGDGNTASGPDATNGGGGLFNIGGMLAISDAVITGNAADGVSGSGGGILSDGGSVTISGSTIENNTAVRAGGGIESTNGASLMIDEVTFLYNVAGSAPGNGGAVHITGSAITEIYGGIAAGNSAAAEGGAFWNGSGSMVIDGTTIGGEESSDGNIASGDDADNGGGGLFNSGGELTVRNASIKYNVADGSSGSGGGILNDGGILRVDSTIVKANSASRAGGGIESNGLPDGDGTERATEDSLSYVTLSNNFVGSAPGNGGGFHLTGPGAVYVVHSLVVANEAANEGGGLWNSGAGTMLVMNSTLSGNTAPEGGGLFQQDGEDSDLSVEYVTITANSATDTGGGFQADGGSPQMSNVIVSGNTATNAGTDCFGDFTSDGYNLIEVTADCNTTGMTSADITGMAALLGDLLDNGGLTQTHALLAGSPAIDSGDCSSSPLLDQRGYLRIAPCDMGSFELNATPVAIEEGDEPVELPRDFLVEPAYPNPFNPTTTIRFAVAERQAITVDLFNVVGQRVRSVFEGTVTPNTYHNIRLEASGLPSGIYLVRVSGATASETQMVTLLK